MIQAIVCSSVPKSGAGISFSTPITGRSSAVYLLVTLCFSARVNEVGSIATPPFAPPKGKPTIADFQDISIDSAVTSPRSTLGAYLMPPFVGPIESTC